VTSARVALLLVRRGIERVRPLLGGLDGWRQSGLPLVDWTGESRKAPVDP
jgi:3-mercaptopyruvate sulfurtransferase SseA